MNLTKLNENLNIIAALSDEPTQTAGELKAKFDEASLKIKAYLNETLIGELEEYLGDIPSVTDNLISTDSASALSAKQGKLLNDAVTANTAAIALKQTAVSGVDETVIGYLAGVSSAIQPQLDRKQKTITSGTADPSGGDDGDIYLKYEA